MEVADFQNALESAVHFQQTGRLTEAENLCHAILAIDPRHVDATCILAGIARHQGRNELAVSLLTQASTIQPDSAPIHFNLANALRDSGDTAQAINHYRKSIAIDPDLAPAHTNLGNLLKNAGKIDQAIESYRASILLRPRSAQNYNNLGAALTISKSLDEAAAACRKAIELKPDFPEAYDNLGNALATLGQHTQARQAYLQALALRPDYAQALIDLANLLCFSREFDAAIQIINKAIAIAPASSKAFSLLGQILAEIKQPQEAIKAFEKALELNPDYSEVYGNLSAVLKHYGTLDDSIDASRKAIALNPAIAEVYCNLGSALKDMGRIDEALEACRTAVRLNPNDPTMHSGLVGTLHYHPDYTPSQIADELANWNQKHALPLANKIPVHRNDPTPNRRLRIGYVSPDFRQHIVGRNVMPLFQNHDHRGFEVTCYSQTRSPDSMTREFERLSDSWRDIAGLSDDAVAKQISEDKIDILVDLALHTAQNRLLVFAQKPAPLQATFAGYPGSTGLTAIDYRISDPYLDPIDMDTTRYSEKTIRLRHSFWCFDPLIPPGFPINSLPALSNGYVTFGCLNNFGKTNDALFALWAAVLHRVDKSRMLILAPEGTHRDLTLKRFAELGISAERLEFVVGGVFQAYLELYHRIDISLDTFPYNGHSTTLDSLWMGVPVVTLSGQTVVSRAGACQLSNVGMPELIAHTKEQFVDIAADLASDPHKVATIRRKLRGAIEASPLMDRVGFARNIESLYRQMWETWCLTATPPSNPQGLASP